MSLIFNCNILHQEYLSEFSKGDYINYFNYFGVYRQYDKADTRTSVMLAVGIYPDYETALMVATEYFDSVPASFTKGFITEENIGDQVWHTSYDRERPSYIALVRKNVFMHIGFARYDDAVELVKIIDNALVNGSSFVELSGQIECPQIISVDVLNPPLVTNEKEYLKVNAYDPLDGELYYRMDNASSNKSADGNEFYAKFSEAGEVTFTSWVVTDKNVYSYKHIMKLSF